MTLLILSYDSNITIFSEKKNLKKLDEFFNEYLLLVISIFCISVEIKAF